MYYNYIVVRPPLLQKEGKLLYPIFRSSPKLKLTAMWKGAKKDENMHGRRYSSNYILFFPIVNPNKSILKSNSTVGD